MVTVRWTLIQSIQDPKWQDNCGLYGYLTTSHDEVLYIGKVDGCTVRQRFNAADKRVLFKDLAGERNINEVSVIVGDIILKLDGAYRPRLTSQKIADVESLLINRVQPWGNIACRESRISRPGMLVTCTGAWPLRRRIFLDEPVNEGAQRWDSHSSIFS
jgi:hypothetical protein